MVDIEKAIAELQEYHDREWTDERTYPATRETRKRVTGNALELLKSQQEEIERLQPKKGKWLEYAGDQKCSVCGSSYSDLFPEYDRTPFCPHCGAKMEGGDGERR